MTTPTVEVMDVDQARARREAVLAAVGGDEEALRARAATYALNARELAALEELDELDFLLGRDDTR